MRHRRYCSKAQLFRRDRMWRAPDLVRRMRHLAFDHQRRVSSLVHPFEECFEAIEPVVPELP